MPIINSVDTCDSNTSPYFRDPSEFMEEYLCMSRDNEEARRLFIFRNKTFSEGDSGASFDKRVYLKEKECENITDTVSGIGTGNNDIQIYYGLRYSSNKDDNKQVEAQFAYDKQFIRNQCECNGLNYKLEQIKGKAHNVIYKLVINDPVSDSVDVLTPQLSDMTIEQTTGTDKVESVVNNPDSVETIWNAHKEYLNRVYNNNAIQDKDHIYSCEQMTIDSTYVKKEVIFTSLNNCKCGVKIKLFVRHSEESSEIITKETIDTIDTIQAQCKEADLSFSFEAREEKTTSIDGTPHKDATYIITIRDKGLFGCPIL